MREGPAPQRADLCRMHRGTTGPGGVRASCSRDDSKIKAEQVGAGCCDVSEGPSLSAMGRRSTASSATSRGPTYSSTFVRPCGFSECGIAAAAGNEELARGSPFLALQVHAEAAAASSRTARWQTAARGKRLKTPPRERSYEWRAECASVRPEARLRDGLAPTSRLDFNCPV